MSKMGSAGLSTQSHTTKMYLLLICYIFYFHIILLFTYFVHCFLAPQLEGELHRGRDLSLFTAVSSPRMHRVFKKSIIK